MIPPPAAGYQRQPLQREGMWDKLDVAASRHVAGQPQVGG